VPFDELVSLERRLTRCQSGRQEQVNPLIRKARSRPDRREPAKLVGPDPGFLLELSGGAGLGRFPIIQLPRRKLPEISARRVPVLSDQDYRRFRSARPLPRSVEGKSRRRTPVPHDLEPTFSAIRVAHVLDIQVEDAAPKHGTSFNRSRIVWQGPVFRVQLYD
jgi:hypothetical protein